jgi:hypothetical protein
MTSSSQYTECPRTLHMNQSTKTIKNFLIDIADITPWTQKCLITAMCRLNYKLSSNISLNSEAVPAS